MEEKACTSSKSSSDSVPKKDEKEIGFSADEFKKQFDDYLMEKKIFLPYGVGPDVDCEVDDDGDEPDYSSYLKRPIDEDDLPERKKTLPYGVGPDTDSEIDDDNDEPDYLNYASVPKEDLVEDNSIPRDAVP